MVQKVCEVEVPEVLKIGGFKDQEICKLMESAYGITNDMYLDRIAYIAEGNARLAMLAGKIASETGKIDSIQDATGLYAHYYGRQLQSISDNETTIVSAGIMAFFQTLRLDHLEALKSLFSEVKLTVEQFVLDLRHLHDLELVDLCHDKAAKISDQSFGNYLIKYVFVDKEIIPLGQMIKICFFINKGKTISSCNVLMNVFSDVSTQGYVKQQINRVWDSLVKETTKFLPFFRAFYSIRPTETLLLLKEKIDLEPHRQFDVTSVPFKKDENERSITDDIIEILCGFKLCSQLSEAIELLLCYYQKRPDLFDQIYSAFSYRLGVDKDSYRFGYFTQTTVVDKLINEVEENPSIENILLFIRVAEKMLYLSFSGAESGRGHSVTFYTVPLIMGPEVVEYRRKLWKKLYDIYKKGVCCKEIESLLMDCCRPQREALEKEIVRSDLESIVDFFENFSVDCLYHCVIAEHIEEVAERAEYSNKYILIPFLNSDKYRMYHTLNANRREMLHMEYGEFEEWHRAQVYDMVQEYDIDAFRYLIDVCQECFETVDPKGGQLSFGLSCAIESFSNNKELYIEAVKVYLGANTPYNVKPYTVLSKLFAMMTAEEVKELIMSCDYAQQNVWLWSFFAELPLDQITDTWANDFLKYLENVPHDLHLSSYRPLEDIEKYKCVDEDILIKASRVILSHYEESAFVFSLYFGLMMNPVRAEAKMIIAKYEKDIPLLEDIYLKMIAYSEHEDFEGRFLKSLLELDPKFLYAYLDKMFVEASERYGAYEKWSERLYILWHDEQYLYYMGQISEYIIEKIGEDSWCYRSVMKHLLSQKSHKTAQIERQEEWIQNSINKYYRDQNRMYALFEAISENNETIRRNALKKLLILNDDFGLFENLPLEPSGWGGVGSMIPHMQKRINYLSSILPLLVGITYLKHKQKVERDIEIWKNRIRQEEIEELIDRLG